MRPLERRSIWPYGEPDAFCSARLALAPGLDAASLAARTGPAQNRLAQLRWLPAPPSHRLGLAAALPAVLRGLAIGGLAVALARPQTVGGMTRIAGQGVAIVVALDQSSSMNAVDFPTDRGTRLISRLEAAKTTFTRFVEGRPDDLIGLVVFANYPDLACPPILDHAFLIETRRRGALGACRGTTAPTSATRSPGDSTPC